MTLRCHLHEAGGHVVACDVLAESFPPQPGGAQVPVTGADVGTRPSARGIEGGDTWTAEAEVVRGTWRDGAVHLEDDAADEQATTDGGAP